MPRSGSESSCRHSSTVERERWPWWKHYARFFLTYSSRTITSLDRCSQKQSRQFSDTPPCKVEKMQFYLIILALFKNWIRQWKPHWRVSRKSKRVEIKNLSLRTVTISSIHVCRVCTACVLYIVSSPLSDKIGVLEQSGLCLDWHQGHQQV